MGVWCCKVEERDTLSLWYCCCHFDLFWIDCSALILCWGKKRGEDRAASASFNHWVCLTLDKATNWLRKDVVDWRRREKEIWDDICTVAVLRLRENLQRCYSYE